MRTVGRRQFPTLEPGTQPSTGVSDISALDKLVSFATLFLAPKGEPWERRVYDLLDALRAFQSGDPFDRRRESEAGYKEEALALAYGPIRHVVFGHTHLARQIELPDERFYFNSGTWADVLRLPPEILTAGKTYGPLAELEKFVGELMRNEFTRFTMFRPTYVRFPQDEHGHSVEPELCDYDG